MSGRIEFYIRKPTGDRVSYAIVRRERASGGAGGPAKVVQSETVDSINAQLRSGQLTAEEAEEAVRREVKRLRDAELPREAKRRVHMHQANLRLLNRYWDAVYAPRAHVDEDAAWNRLRRAIEALGDTPLTASRDPLQAALNTKYKAKPSRQRDAAAALNQILKWMGRPDVRLVRMKKPRKRIRHLTPEELGQVLPQLQPTSHRQFVQAAYATGARTGEIFAFDRAKYDTATGSIYVDDQVDRKQERRETKNRRERDIPVLPEGLAWIEEWLALPAAEKRKLRGVRWSDVVRRACKRVFKDQPEKWLTAHNLRDSYAVQLILRGVPIKLVAQALGDTVAVVEESYGGFVLSPEGVHEVRRILGARQSPGQT